MDTESKKPTELLADDESESRAEVTIEVTSDDATDEELEDLEDEEDLFGAGISVKQFLMSMLPHEDLMVKFLDTIWPDALEQLDALTEDPVVKNTWYMAGIMDPDRVRVANLQSLTLMASTIAEPVREAVVNENLANAIDAVAHLLSSHMLSGPVDTSNSLIASANFNVIYRHSTVVDLASEATDARVRFLTSLESIDPDERFHSMMVAGYDEAVGSKTLIPQIPVNYLN